ncbi:MAG TPA: tetratricopeptide repeat protein [Polyangiaceae bacterium]|jgi:hypothetical protein|nr:tetratricopeptide repeat protein [Polyangiaceae bacterium]
MSDMKRWDDEGAPESIRRLFEAARDEEPARAGVARTMTALGLGAAAATSASHAAASGAGAAKVAAASTFGIAMKWGTVGAVCAVVGALAVHEGRTMLGAKSVAAGPKPSVATMNVARAAAMHAATTPNVVMPSAVAETAVDAPSEPVAAHAETAATDAESAKSGAGALAGSTKAVALAAPARDESARSASDATPSRLLEEVKAIDGARTALSSGDANGTLAALDGYRATFPAGRFKPEALYLRMEALERAGDPAGARAAAQRLLAEFPNSPQAARSRLVAAESESAADPSKHVPAAESPR